MPSQKNTKKKNKRGAKEEHDHLLTKSTGNQKLDLLDIEDDPDVLLNLHPSCEDEAGLINGLLFCFVGKYFWRTWSADKDSEYLEQPMERFRAKTATKELTRNWYQGRAKKRSFFKVLFQTVWPKLSLLGLFLLIEELTRIAQPVYMGMLMACFRADPKDFDMNSAMKAAAGVSASAIFVVLMHHPIFHGMLRLGCEMKSGTAALIYRKGLRITCSSLQLTSTGQMINILSTDVPKLESSFLFVHYLWMCPILLIGYGYVVYQQMGFASAGGFVALFCFIGVQTYISIIMGRNRQKIADRGDKRLSVMSEIISGIRVIKMYAWENAFSDVVDELRNYEVAGIRTTSVYSAAVMGMFFVSSKVALLFAMVVYLWLGNEINSEQIFVTSALYNSLRLPFALFLPLGVHLTSELRTTCSRIDNFMSLREYSRTTIIEEIENENEEEQKENEPMYKLDNVEALPKWTIDIQKNNEATISMSRLTTTWFDENDSKQMKPAKKSKKNGEESKPPTLTYAIQNFTMKLKHGECIGVVGQVGSGKSSLLLSILGEAKIRQGSLEVHGKIAYCAQEPWLHNGTVRENICLGSEYNEERYREAIELCCLVQDFEQLAKGDRTQVGDRGSTLSGGQRARISLARAVYSNPDIVLLDDPLSAVDANVGRQLYEKVIREHFKDKLVILVTHQLQYLDDLETIILMKHNSVLSINNLNGLKVDYEQEFAHFHDRKKTIPIPKFHASRSSSTQTLERQMSISSYQDVFPAFDVKDAMEKMFSEEIDDDDNSTEHLLTNDNEERATGTVPFSVYWAYIKEVCSPGCQGTTLALVVIATQVLTNIHDWWLSKWVTSAEKWSRESNTTGSSLYADRYSYFGYEFDVSSETYLHTFAILTLILSIFGIVRCIWFRIAQLGASRNLHTKMFRAVANTNIEFFDNNSDGRILNRFSKDIAQTDDQMAFVFFELALGLLTFVGIIFVIIFLSPWVFFASVPITVAFYAVRYVYVRRSRDLKRLESTTRSPLNTHVASTLNGLATIRAYGMEREMLGKFFEAQDMNTAAYNTGILTSRWFAICIDLLVSLFITCVSFVSLWQYSTLSSGEVALSLVYAVQLTGFFSWMMRQSAELQNGMVSVERIIEYTKLKSEHVQHQEKHSNVEMKDEQLGEHWPKHGTIKFSNVEAKYGDEKVLSNVTFEIEAKQKIGIVGRTGAGKSTLLRVLFGLKDNSAGKITIDGTDVNEISLKFRRNGMSIIPQEPVLFTGTVRQNLDPFNKFRDDMLWEALEQCELKRQVSEMGGLLAPMASNGSNFSVGQRQLVCLARAIIHGSRILVIDEATANVDGRTDAIIQKTIRNRFVDSTLLTIAHRLNTIMDSDKIMVFENGRLVEFDSPKKLMDDKKSALWRMAAQSGAESATLLKEMAHRSHNEKICEDDDENV